MIRTRPIVALSLFALLFAAPASAGAGGTFTSAFSSFFGGEALVGSFSIVEEDGQRFIEFAPEFKAQSAPDLKVFLSTRAPGAVTGANATAEAVRLGALESFEGRQRYAVPEGTDLSKFSTVIVHCEEYSKLWGAGALK